jgi:lysozyme
MTLYTVCFILINAIGLNVNDWRPIKALGIAVPLAYETHGIDVSHHNGRINWKTVSTVKHENFSIDFAYIKASEGASFTDATYAYNWNQAKAVGINRGAYHYFIPWIDAQKQADNFTKIVKLQPGDLPPVLDIEEPCLLPDRIVVKAIANWLYVVEKKYGVKPIIYTNPLHYNLYIKGKFDKYPLWIANYTAKTVDKYPKTKLQFWQYSKEGKIPGIKGLVDFNVSTQTSLVYEQQKLQ